MLKGGTTPSAGCVLVAKRANIPIHMMIRPRGGDFCYNDVEFECMKIDVVKAKEYGVAGVVFGILLPDGTIDKPRTKELVTLAKPLNVTIHRAFDMTRDAFEALEDLIAIGLPLLKMLVEAARGRISILPGGGITPRNLSRILSQVPFPEVHMALPSSVDSKMVFRNGAVFMGVAITTPEYAIPKTDPKLVKNVTRVLHGKL
ncbi:hypothetical protein SmJEL517_g05265 [Synchytrium microbalum]|uniref:Copper homeostasis protein cutC homolog n=1 Tax=Synchytrium microbalum TaxID=1806994 RepID=A0A507BW86_9FUNG|nr:uncharacterized protein SmJEL517_g05265 [Synchytrium microbalum]TPX31391.1 hypothetical protein SmJEL517_g05265 [Synchytrium microbalum]